MCRRWLDVYYNSSYIYIYRLDLYTYNNVILSCGPTCDWQVSGRSRAFSKTSSPTSYTPTIIIYGRCIIILVVSFTYCIYRPFTAHVLFSFHEADILIIIGGLNLLINAIIFRTPRYSILLQGVTVGEESDIMLRSISCLVKRKRVVSRIVLIFRYDAYYCRCRRFRSSSNTNNDIRIICHLKWLNNAIDCADLLQS